MTPAAPGPVTCGEAPAWATRLSAGAPAAVVARCLRVAAARGTSPDRLREVVARRLAAGHDPDAETVLSDLEAGDPQLRLPAPGPAGTDSADGGPAADTGGAAGALLAAGARMHVVGYPPYPARLAAAWPELGAPLWLFVRSRDGALPAGPAVAVVGTRHPTLDGLETARALARLLADRGVTVVSGMARGIDQAAHRGALDAGGVTIAVLGTGLDVDYPARDGPLRDAVAAAGGLVSEYLAGTRPRPPNFLWRNRIIAGLADATVVVEGGVRSGALHTARLAGAQGREVLAVPGSLNQPTSRGPLDLIRDGATPVTRLEDVLTAIEGPAAAGAPGDAAAAGPPGGGGGAAANGPPRNGAAPANGPPRSGAAPANGPPRSGAAPGVGATAASVLSLVGATPARPGALAAAAGLSMPEAMAAIGELVARGLVSSTPRGITRASGR